MGYNYNKKSVTCFIASLGSGTTCYMNQPYIQRFTDNFGNIREKAVMRNELTSFYFWNSNVIDTHSNECQFQLKLKKWKTRDPFFWIYITLVAFSVIDAYRLYKVNNPDRRTHITVLQFANILAGQLIRIRQLISSTINTNQWIRRENWFNNDCFTDRTSKIHILSRGNTVKVSETSGKMYRPA